MKYFTRFLTIGLLVPLYVVALGLFIATPLAARLFGINKTINTKEMKDEIQESWCSIVELLGVNNV